MEIAKSTINRMFRMLALGIILREKFMGAVLFANACGLLTDEELSFLNSASLAVTDI